MFTPQPACPVGHGGGGGRGEAGWGWSSAWPWSRPDLRSSLSLSLFEESSFTFPMWVDSTYPKHWNPQDLELSMAERQRQLPPGAPQSHC